MDSTRDRSETIGQPPATEPVGQGYLSTGGAITPLDVLVPLVRKWRFLFAVTCVSALCALVLVLLLPLTYTATTTLLPPQQSSSFSSTLLSQLGGLGSLAGASGLSALKNPTDLYVGLLQSSTVVDGMIQRFDLQREYGTKSLLITRKVFASHVTIDGAQKDGLIRISVRSGSPTRAAELANGYVAEYRRLSASLAIGEASQRRLFLEQQLQDAKNHLADAEEDLKRTEQTSGMIQLDSQTRALIESAGSLRAQIAEKEVQVQSMRTYAGPGNVELMQAEQELSGLQGQLSKLGGTDADGELLPSKGKLPQQGLDYLRKVREVKYDETIFDILARQYEAAKLDEAKEGSVVQVVDVAKPPDRKSGPPRLLIIIGISFFDLFVAICWISGKEIMRAMWRDPRKAATLHALGLRH